MAEHIEREALLKHIDEHGARLGITVANRCNFKDIAKMIPATDFVPRTEVEKEYGNALQTAFNEGKLEGGREVAREIFAELMNCRVFRTDGIEGYVKVDIDELKKKYTGGE